MNKNNILIAIVVLIIVAAGGYFMFGSGFGHSGPVAVVNGEEINQQDYNFIKDQIKEQSSIQGQELSGDQLEEQALNQVISQTLILQKAEEEGFSATEEEVNNQYQSVITRAGGQDALDQVLSDLGLTEDYIKEDIRQQVIIEKYVQSQGEGESLEVTDQEVSDFYDQMSSQQENAPAFDQVESQIRSQLEQQKQGQLVSEIVSQLRENAEIEILL